MILNGTWSYAPTFTALLSMMIYTLFIESLIFYIWWKDCKKAKTPITLAEIIIIVVSANVVSGFLGILFLVMSI